MMTVIVTACEVFGLTVVSEAKTEIACLQTKDGRKLSFTSLQPVKCTNKRSSCVLGRGSQS